MANENNEQMTIKEKLNSLLLIFQILIEDESVFDSETKKKIEEILEGISSNRGVLNLKKMINNTKDTVSELINGMPYLSKDQCEAVLDDLKELFDELADTEFSGDVINDMDCFEENCRKIKKPTYSLKRIPEDACAAAAKNIIPAIVRGAIRDVFKQQIADFSPDAKLWLDTEIDKAIEENIRRFID